eukprot:5753006-Lingulodinium_polyedra.AAC.1
MPVRILHRPVQAEHPVGGLSLRCLSTSCLRCPRLLWGNAYVLNVCLLVMEVPRMVVPRATAPRMSKVSSR